MVNYFSFFLHWNKISFSQNKDDKNLCFYRIKRFWRCLPWGLTCATDVGGVGGAVAPGGAPWCPDPVSPGIGVEESNGCPGCSTCDITVHVNNELLDYFLFQFSSQLSKIDDEIFIFFYIAPQSYIYLGTRKIDPEVSDLYS